MTASFLTRICDNIQFGIWSTHAVFSDVHDVRSSSRSFAYASARPSVLPEVTTGPVHTPSIPDALEGPPANDDLTRPVRFKPEAPVWRLMPLFAQTAVVLLFGLVFSSDVAQPPVIAAPPEGMTLPNYFEYFQKLSELQIRIMVLQETLRQRRAQHAAADDIRLLEESLHDHMRLLFSLSQVATQFHQMDIQNSGGATGADGAEASSPTHAPGLPTWWAEHAPQPDYDLTSIMTDAGNVADPAGVPWHNPRWVFEAVMHHLGVEPTPGLIREFLDVTQLRNESSPMRVLAVQPAIVLIEIARNVFYVIWTYSQPPTGSDMAAVTKLFPFREYRALSPHLVTRIFNSGEFMAEFRGAASDLSLPPPSEFGIERPYQYDLHNRPLGQVGAEIARLLRFPDAAVLIETIAAHIGDGPLRLISTQRDRALIDCGDPRIFYIVWISHSYDGIRNVEVTRLNLRRTPQLSDGLAVFETFTGNIDPTVKDVTALTLRLLQHGSYVTNDQLAHALAWAWGITSDDIDRELSQYEAYGDHVVRKNGHRYKNVTVVDFDTVRFVPMHTPQPVMYTLKMRSVWKFNKHTGEIAERRVLTSEFKKLHF